MATLERKIGQWVFRAELPAEERNEKVSFSGSDVRRFEHAAARWIVENGAMAPETFRFLRAVANYRQAQLAELLGVSSETISRWESGHNEFGVSDWETLAALALDRVSGSLQTEQQLRAVAEHRAERSKMIDLELDAA